MDMMIVNIEINLKNTLKASKQKMYEYICDKKYNTNIFTALLKTQI